MRPNWDEYFMASAFLASFRSHDEQSKVGAVLVNSENKKSDEEEQIEAYGPRRG